ncbi:MAG: substrate-binding domain-containing protein [Burkholderiales bacterium]|nr:substrate-binding domain-containing protein [Burkholderiales bacterium]
MTTIRTLALGALVLTLVACGEKPAAPAGPSAADQPPHTNAPGAPVKIALIMKAHGNPFFTEMEKGARQAQHELGVDLVVRDTDEETAIEQQIKLVDDEITDHVSAIVIAPVDSRRLVPALKKAQDAGIKIVNLDNHLDHAFMQERAMAPVPFISIDNEMAAYHSAKFIADAVTEPSEAAILEGIRHAANANERKQGAERAFKENPKINLIMSETANWSLDEAYVLAKRSFAEHPKLKLVFCANDMMALGVIKYLKEAGRHDVRIASFDALDDAKRAIRAGDLMATIDQQADKQGYEGIVTALKSIRGEQVPAEIKLDAALVTAQTLKQK